LKELEKNFELDLAVLPIVLLADAPPPVLYVAVVPAALLFFERLLLPAELAAG